MKRLGLIIMMVTMTFCFTACGGSEPELIVEPTTVFEDENVCIEITDIDIANSEYKLVFHNNSDSDNVEFDIDTVTDEEGNTADYMTLDMDDDYYWGFTWTDGIASGAKYTTTASRCFWTNGDYYDMSKHTLTFKGHYDNDDWDMGVYDDDYDYESPKFEFELTPEMFVVE